jgi:glycosyltransferase involved in cell wall biosynthesis
MAPLDSGPSVNGDRNLGLRVFIAHPSGLLTDHLPHGDGLVAHGFIRELAARGHDLHVAAQRVDLREPLPPNVRVYPLGTGRSHAARLTFMWSMGRLYRRLRRGAPFDIVHQLNPVDVGISLALPNERAPIVLGPYVPDWPRAAATPRLKRALRAAQQRRATTVLLSTPAAASKVEAPRRVHVRELSPGIDDRVWAPAGDGEGQDVLFLANLEARKGVHVAVDAFARVAAELPQARLLVGGEGSEADAVRRRVRELPAAQRVTLLGHVERGRVREVMRACAVYCLPSYGEPFGMTALEAMACAKPIVATDAGGLRYLVPDEGGRKVPPGDAGALAAALRDVLTQPGLRRFMGEHNRRVVEERYAWSRVVDRLEEIYLEAIKEPFAALRLSR